ncbi:DNA polymerase III subunit delta [Candidatus Uhrbacteria bacterium]|nr:DNA polymerase III subunit delta [Candidatus Uhrbacteria bacterium]
MLILIYGDDTFRVQEKVRHMRQAFLDKFDKSGMNLAEFPVKGSSAIVASEVLQAACSYPFLSPKRMVIVEGLISATKKDEQSVWVQGLARIPQSTIVVLWESIEPAALEKKPFFKELLKMAEVHTYPFVNLQGPALSKWASDRVGARGARMSRTALQELVTRVGGDLWRLSQEIEKLIAYASGQEVTKEMVEALVEASFEGKIFELMDAISKRQPARALQLLKQERLSGNDDHYVLTMLGRQVRILLSTRCFLDEHPGANKNQVAEAIGVHPFVASKAVEQARLFSFDHLSKAHDLLFSFDQKLKTGRISAGLAVDLIVDHFTHS